MKANFDISLPSIPGKNIKFKIQDIKTSAFGSQKARFPDNKSLLTQKFIDSFNNFHQSKQDDDLQTKPESLDETRSSGKTDTKFRLTVPENKRFLLQVYSQLKKKQKSDNLNGISHNKLSGLSFSFSKSGNKEQKNNVGKEYFSTSSQQNLYNYDEVTDNYYFTADERTSLNNNRIVASIQKKVIPSASFKVETRKRVYERIEHSIVPGPGAYLGEKVKKAQSVPNKKEQTVPNKKEQKKKERVKKADQFDYKHLREVITNIVAEQPEQNEDDTLKEKSEVKNDHMFILDDKDRFGEQIFPIAPKLKVPGPGSYDIGNTIEDKSKKIMLVEEQRKLLKQWFNN